MTDTSAEAVERIAGVLENEAAHMNRLADIDAANRLAALLRALLAERDAAVKRANRRQVETHCALAERDAARAEAARLRDLVRTLLTNDPDDAIADGGHTVLDLWRHEARQLLAGTAP